MNINLIYQGVNYNFDLRKDTNIKYIRDLASKLISKDSSSFELLYKNENLSEYGNATLIKDLIKDDKNICIIIWEKNKNKPIKNDENKKLKKIRDFDQVRNTSHMNDTKIMLNSPLITPINSKNKSMNKNFNQIRIKKRKSKEYITENTVFEDIYNLKEKEIFSLMKSLTQKIKEYDGALYKKYKNNLIANKKLSGFEKVIIDYKDKQISFLKKVNEYFSNEYDFFSGEIQLDEFCNELKKYNNPKNIVMLKNDNNDNISFNNINGKNISKINTKIKFSGNINNYNKRNIKENKKLPLLSNTKIKNNRYFLSDNKNMNNNTINSEDSDNSNFKEENIFLNSKFNSDNRPQKNKNIIKENKKEALNKTESNAQNINSNKAYKALEKNIINNNNKKTKNSIYNNTISLSNTNDNTTTSQNTTIQPKNKNSILGNRINLNLIYKTKTNQSNQRINTLANIKKNKIDILFETENENKPDNISNNISEISNNNSKLNKDLSKIGDENKYIFTRSSKEKKNQKK